MSDKPKAIEFTEQCEASAETGVLPDLIYAVAEELRRLHAANVDGVRWFCEARSKIAEMERELEAVGDGGVQPLRSRCQNCGSPGGKCLEKFSCTSQQLKLPVQVTVAQPVSASEDKSVNQQMLNALRAAVTALVWIDENHPGMFAGTYDQVDAAIALAKDRRKEILMKSAITGHVNIGNSEDRWIESSKHLNCPACGGSGHVDDVIKHKQLTDKQIENAVQKHGGKWNGSFWKIEDADLHPMIRGIVSQVLDGGKE